MNKNYKWLASHQKTGVVMKTVQNRIKGSTNIIELILIIRHTSMPQTKNATCWTMWTYSYRYVIVTTWSQAEEASSGGVFRYTLLSSAGSPHWTNPKEIQKARECLEIRKLPVKEVHDNDPSTCEAKPKSTDNNLFLQ